MKVYIRPDANYFNTVKYVLKIIEKNQNIKFEYVKSSEVADVFWDHTNQGSQITSQQFHQILKGNRSNLVHSFLFKKRPAILDSRGNKDIIATIFYMINCLQEYNCGDDDLDHFGRFKFESSYQFRFNNIEENLVQQNIDQFLKEQNIKSSKKKSTFFISHDIDAIYGSFLQDGFWALKNMRLGVILTLIMNELIRKPHWKNIDKIIKINNEFDVKSTFFWLVNKGRGIASTKNADYNVNRERELIQLVDKSGFVNGLHKSCSEMSINAELEKGNLSSTYNRYHFLRFLPRKDWKKISDSKINFDCSLGFAERYGFRNSYGIPFQPFNIEENQPYDFVEAPLNFMDRTFHKYMNTPSDKIAKIIIDFFEKNSYNCLFSLLWHNIYFTNYKYNSFLREYKKVMGYIYENKIESMNPKQIIEQYTLT
jgi:hypothetical protein